MSVARVIERHGGARNLAAWAVLVHRFGTWARDLRSPLARRVTSKLYGASFLAVELATGITLNREARIGDDLYLVHAGNIKVHPDAVIGDRCTIFNDVTIGTNEGMTRDGAPRIGNDVYIGPGARILGKVTVGDGARVAANSLVLTDVPAGATAIGVPARVMRPSAGAAAAE